MTCCPARPVPASDESFRPLATLTLTFLFTDIEGSTALLQRLGDTYAEVLTAHHGLIRTGLAAHGGREIDTQGDAFFAVFSSPRACVAAAIEMQRALGSYPWPDGEAVRVRMGIHSGEAAQTAAGLVGLDVHRAARIAATAHGGQVVLSDSARTHLAESLGIFRALNDRDGVVYETFNLGLAEYLRGSPGVAEAYFAESLDLARRVQMKASIAYALIGLAMAGSGADGGRSARLHGAADQALAVLGETVEPLEGGLRDLDRQRLRAAMGDEAFEAGYAAGRALAPGEALALALGNGGLSSRRSRPAAGTARCRATDPRVSCYDIDCPAVGAAATERARPSHGRPTLCSSSSGSFLSSSTGGPATLTAAGIPGRMGLTALRARRGQTGPEPGDTSTRPWSRRCRGRPPARKPGCPARSAALSCGWITLKPTSASSSALSSPPAKTASRRRSPPLW
jgi:hypothetical protein